MEPQERSEQADGRREQKTETIQYPGGGGNDGKKKRKAETKQRKTLVDQRASVGRGEKKKKKNQSFQSFLIARLHSQDR